MSEDEQSRAAGPNATPRPDVPADGPAIDPAAPPSFAAANAADVPTAETELRTFLIADIRGYTSYTEEHGDAAATALAGRFATLVREVVEGRQGFLLELRGDEALAVFTSARQALKAANEIQRRQEIDSLPREIGIGLDAGEAIPFEGGFRGSALNLAARLCAQAGPGQVIASEAVIHLAARVEGLAYVEPRTMHLKGLDEPVRAVTVVPEGRAPKRRRAEGGRPRIERRGLLAAGGVAVIAVLVGTLAWAGPLGGLGGGGSTASASPSPGQVGASPTPTPSQAPGAAEIDPGDLPLLAFLDPATGDVRELLREPDNAADAIYADGSFWVLGRKPRAIYQLDPESGEVGATIPIAFDVAAFTVGDDKVFVAERENLVRVFDAPSGRELDQLWVAEYSEGREGVFWSEPVWDVAYGDGSLWVAKGWSGRVARVDPATGVFTTVIGTGAAGGHNRSDSIAYADDSLWASDSVFGQVVRIDTATNNIETRTTLEAGIEQILAGGGYGWVLSPADGNVVRVDARGEELRYPVDPGTASLAYDPETATVWTASRDAGTVTRIDAVSGTPVTAYLGHATGPVAAQGEHVLAAVSASADEIVAGLEGTVLRIATDEDLAHTDPAFEWHGPARRQLDQLTCARLLDYPLDASGSSLSLAPAVAAAMPDVSGDGRTYTFRIREGFAFSPPSNEPLTAETYRYSIERALSPVMDPVSTGFPEMLDIEGIYAYRDGLAEHISGLSAEGDRLTIRLSAPSPTFLERLWLGYFCPVPVGTPVVATGLVDPSIPSAGPYYIANQVPGDVLVVRRNPNYPAPRPGSFDAIAWFTEPDLRRSIGRVDQGSVDYVDGHSSELVVGSRTDQRWGPESAAATTGDQRLFHRPDHATEFLAVNPGSEALADTSIRRALALALDRRVLAQAGGIATDDLLPMTMPGQVDRNRYPLDESGIDEARTLLAGRHPGLRISFPSVVACGSCTAVGEALVAQLEEAGFTVLLSEADYPAMFAEGTDSGYDLVWTRFRIDYPDTAAWIGGALTETDDPLASRYSAAYPGGWLPADIVAERDRVAALEGPERIEGAVALADRLADELVVIPIVNDAYSQLVAERIGCVDGQPYQAEMHLLAMCLD